MGLKIYLAARMGRKEEMRGYAETLEEHGHRLMSAWVKTEGDDGSYDGYTLTKFAELDLRCLEQCDAFILFTDAPGEEIPGASRGGRFVEMGYAIAKKKRLCVIGPLENIFCRLQGIEQFDTIEEFLKKYGGAK